jgi:predicted ATPase
VIIGRNCVGKSYFASLLYTILNALRVRLEEPTDIFFSFVTPRDLEISFKDVSPDSSEEDIVARIVELLLEKYRIYLEKSLKTQMERIFGVKIDDLIRLGVSNARIQFKLSPDFSFFITLKKLNRISLRLEIDRKKLLNDVMNSVQKKGRGIFARELSRWRHGKRPSSRIPPLFGVYFIITQALFETIIPKEGRNAVYIIPAGRAGLLEGYNTVQSALFSLSPIAPIQGLSMPPIPGAASEFYKVLLQLQGRKGPFNSLAESFEKMLGGKITIKSLSKPKGKTTITYSFKSDSETGEIDIIHAASGIKELAILYLIITEFIRKGDFLIIEEPESHLHPEAQIKLMEIISYLVRRGVRVFITTHSDLLLRKIAQQTGRYIRSKGRDLSSVNPEDFSVYLLKETKSGSVSKEIPITKYGSLEEIPTFDEVMRELYKEGVSLQFHLQMKE